MNALDTPRWKHLLAQLDARTSIDPSDLKVLEDSEVRCEVELTLRQRAAVEHRRSKGNGRSGATLLADVALLAPAARDERQRLEQSLPDRARRWLARAPGLVNSLPAAADFDAQARSYAVDSACVACEHSGCIVCEHCMQGKIECPTCGGVKHRTCGTCHGNGDTSCGTCWGTGSSKCTACNGTGDRQCGLCNRSGKVPCGGCGGMGFHRRSQQVLKDIGKGPFYETVTIDEPCNTCHGSGKATCGMCGGLSIGSCGHCDRGARTCDTCKGRRKMPCTGCSATGQVTCDLCDAAGRAGCGICAASGKVDCRSCGARGWTHVREDIFTRLTAQRSTRWSSATPAALVPHLDDIVASAEADREGRFELQHQQVDTAVATALTRTWKGTFMAWTMRFEVEGKPFALHAAGNSQQVLGLDAVVEQLLVADRDGLAPALAQGGTAATRAVERYLRSPAHASAVLEACKSTAGSVRRDVQAVSAHIAGKEAGALSSWRWATRTAVVLLGLPVLLGLRLRFDLIAWLLLPLVVVTLGRFIQRKAALRAVTQVTGNPSFAQSWERARHAIFPPARGRTAAVLWGLLLVGLVLWISPAKPLALAYAASDLRIKAWQALPGLPITSDAHLATLNDWLACRSNQVDGLLVALRSLPTSSPGRDLNVAPLQRGIPEKTWRPDGVELQGRKVQSLTLRATISPATGSLEWLGLEARLAPLPSDPQTLQDQLSRAVQRAPGLLDASTRTIGSDHRLTSSTVVLERGQGVGKAGRSGAQSLLVTCQYRPGDWLRIAR